MLELEDRYAPTDHVLNLDPATVNRIRDGSQTQIRAPVEPSPPGWFVWTGEPIEVEPEKWKFVPNPQAGNAPPLVCPFGTTNHQLWVREPHAVVGSHVVYAADFEGRPAAEVLGPREQWKSAKSMAKRSVRIWLVVKKIGIERLQSISAEDLERSGVRPRFGLVKRGTWAGEVDSPVMVYGTSADRVRCLMLDTTANWKFGDRLRIRKDRVTQVPAQDGQVWWSLARTSTNYFPCLLSMFEDQWDAQQKPLRKPRFWVENPWVWRVGFERICRPAAQTSERRDAPPRTP